MNVHDEDDFVFVCLLGAYIRALRQQECHQQLLRGMVSVEHEGRRRRRRARRPRSMWVRAWVSEETRMKLPCRSGRFIHLVRPRAPCQTVVELYVNPNTPARIVIERDETANAPVARRGVREKSWHTRIKRAATLKQPQLNGNLT